MYILYPQQILLKCLQIVLCKTDDASTAHPGDDVSYSIRHVEESWHHLMKSEDTAKFKKIAVFNFDFLLAAVSEYFTFIVFTHTLSAIKYVSKVM